MTAPLLRVEHLSRHFKIGGALSKRTLHAVDDVNFQIGQREIVALAGESGSGKSTIARLLARVYQPTSGEVYFSQGEEDPGTPLSAMRTMPIFFAITTRTRFIRRTWPATRCSYINSMRSCGSRSANLPNMR